MIILTVAGLAVLGIVVFASLFEIHGAEKVTYQVDISKNRLQAGESLAYRVEIANAKLLVLPIINVVVSVPYSFSYEIDHHSIGKNSENNVFKTVKITSSLLSYQKVKQTFDVVAKERGFFEIRTSGSTQDLIGMKNLSLFSGDSKLVMVRPKPINFLFMNYDANSIQGDVLVRRWSNPDPIFYSGVREYTERDSLKDIEWKASAKMGDLVVKKYDTTSDESFMYLLMSHRSHRYEDMYVSVLEDMFSSIAYMCEINQHDGIPYAFNTNLPMRNNVNNFLIPEIGKQHLVDVWDKLACAQRVPDLLPTTYVAEHIDVIDQNTTLVFYYYSLEESDVYMLNQLYRDGHMIKVIICQESEYHPLPQIEILMFKGGDYHVY